MFKKIVSQLSFSPALVGQLSFYAKRLRKEQTTRRLGLVFVALALVVQSLVVFQPPESANAANPADMIPGGLGIGSARSLNNFLAPYDRNDYRLKDTMNYFGITRAEIAATQFSTFSVSNQISWGFENRAAAKGFTIPDSAGNPVTTLYGRPMTTNNPVGDTMYAYVGYSAKTGWFAILQSCGNLITDKYPTPPAPPAPTPASITTSKSAVNVSQGNIDATKATAKVNNKITFKLSAKNSGGTAQNVDFSDNLTSTLKYAKLTDQGGGTFNASTKVLSWPAISVAPGATVTKSFTVQMNSSLESAQATCSITNTFTTNTITVPVGCTPPPAPANITTSKTAVNTSQGSIDATKTTAKANNKITFNLTAKNTGGTAKSVTFSDDLSSTLAYSKLTDKGSGTFNASTEVLSWPAVNIAPGTTVTKTFSVQVNSSLESSQTNCKIINSFTSSTVTVPVGCTPPPVPPKPKPPVVTPADIALSKSANNLSQGNIDATTEVAKEKDRITYTLTAENKGGTAKEVTFTDNIGDILEYSKIVDNGGATYSQKTRDLSWPAVTLQPGAKEIRTFTIQILDQIPATPKGMSDPSSYDCRLENNFGNDVIINVTCPAPKVIEQVVPELPHTGPRENMIFAGALFSVVAFFYFRSRQLGTEVRLIRRDLNGGSI